MVEVLVCCLGVIQTSVFCISGYSKASVGNGDVMRFEF
jgi:hypothetical protein